MKAVKSIFKNINVVLILSVVEIGPKCIKGFREMCSSIIRTSKVYKLKAYLGR